MQTAILDKSYVNVEARLQVVQYLLWQSIQSGKVTVVIVNESGLVGIKRPYDGHELAHSADEGGIKCEIGIVDGHSSFQVMLVHLVQ